LEAEMTAATKALGTVQAKLDLLIDLRLDCKVDAETYARKEVALEAFCAAVVDGGLDALERPEQFERGRDLLRRLISTVWVRPDGLPIDGELPGLGVK
jgi:hypothetical protein